MFWAQFYHSLISDRQSRRWTVARIWLVRSNYCDFVTWTLKILEGLQQSFSKECSAVSDPLHRKQPRLFVVLIFRPLPARRLYNHVQRAGFRIKSWKARNIRRSHFDGKPSYANRKSRRELSGEP
jgi:hypothetical protein